jgi:small subunit ribosomal protein S1
MDQNNNNQDKGEPVENDQNENQPNMESLLNESDLGINLLKSGDIKHGTIASISPGQILVSVGAKSEGIINGNEFEAIPPEEFAAMQVGQDILVYVINPEDQNGNLVLSYVRALEESTWLEAEKFLTSKETYKGQVVGYNKGGLLVAFNKLRGFIPASQFSFSRRAAISGDSPEQSFGPMVGQEINVCIIEVDRERRRLIVSERAASNETRESIRDKVIDNLAEGEERTGTVTSLADFGAFVNINGADGLVHLSEISWERIRHPGDVLKVGQQVNVKVISIDKESKRIGLSIRARQSDPWYENIKSFKVGQLVEGTITRLTKFGAFAKLDNDLEGLIHISELSEKHIDHPKEALHEGDIVTLRIIKIEPESHRIGLSLRRVESQQYTDLDMKILQNELESNETPEKPSEEEKPEPKKKNKKKIEPEDSETKESELPEIKEPADDADKKPE